MKPRRVVLDSNVYISAFLFGGMPGRAVGHVIEGAVECFVSLAILDEIRGVLQRPKFGLSAEQALSIVEEIHALCHVVTPSVEVDEIAPDPDDNRVLECALAARADTIVSGDSHLLSLKPWRGIAIFDPAAFVERMDSFED